MIDSLNDHQIQSILGWKVEATDQICVQESQTIHQEQINTLPSFEEGSRAEIELTYYSQHDTYGREISDTVLPIGIYRDDYAPVSFRSEWSSNHNT